MSRYYLRYRFRLEEPLIISNGSQIGNVLTTRDHVPGTTILGLCASLYLREKGYVSDTAHTIPEFRDLFLSEKTIYSPAYPVVEGYRTCIPMPHSVFGCKYYGFSSPMPMGRTMHGISDYLYREIPKTCHEQSCDDLMEHKSGYCYFKGENGPFTHEVSKRIITHNRVAEASKDNDLFSFETMTEGQKFYGEISFPDVKLRNTIFDLLVNNSVAKLGKARRRGYGRVKIYMPVKKDRTGTYRKSLGNVTSTKGIFSVYLFSDAIILDNALNYCSRIDKNALGSFLEINPEHLKIYPQGPEDRYKSFWKTGIVMGFNEKRRMPLPAEHTVSRGSVFTVLYKGNDDISGKLEALLEKGLGVRRNEGFGQVIINLKSHKPESGRGNQKNAGS